MPKYTQRHLDIVQAMAQALPAFPPAAHLSDESGWGYLVKFRNYLLSHENPETGADLATYYTMISKSVETGSGVKVQELNMPGVLGKSVAEGITSCDECIRDILKDRDLMQREPFMHAILKYADLQFRLIDNEDLEPDGFLSDKVTNTVSTIISQLQKPPSAEQMKELQRNYPGAYEAGMKMMALINAYADYYYPEQQIGVNEAAKLDPEQLRQQKMQKLQALKDATKDFADVSVDSVGNFLTLTGNDDHLSWFKYIYDEDSKISVYSAVTQLEQQISLVNRGLSLDETRLLSDFAKFMKGVKGEMFGNGGRKIDDMVEPFRTQGLACLTLAQECEEKLQNGFADEQEKNEFFRRLYSESEKLSDSLLNIDLSTYDNSIEDYDSKMAATFSFVQVAKPQAESRHGCLYHAIALKDRQTSLEHADQWIGRVEMNTCYAALRNTGTDNIGEKGSTEYKSYKSMMAAIQDVTKLSLKKNPNKTVKDLLGDKSRIVIESGSAYLNKVFNKTPEELQAMNAKQRDLLKDRAAGVIGFMKGLSPHKAEALRNKASALFGHDVTWDEIVERTKEAHNRKPNYSRYYELHTGEYAQNIPQNKVAEYMAKAASALFFMDDTNKKFDVDIPRAYAGKMQELPDFKAAVKAFGEQKLREALTSGDPKAIADIVRGGSERYAVSGQTKAKLKALSETMNTKNRSKKWTALKDALSKGDMKDSRKVFDAIEDYVKGKKSVSRDTQRKESVKIALDALAIVAENGDAVAKARAQNLIDRFNQVRKTGPEDPNHIKLADYGKNVAAGAQQQAEVQNNVNHI